MARSSGCSRCKWPWPNWWRLREGWLYTGDVGRMDADGYIYVRGRSSERLTVAGEGWYPRDVEEAVLEHPGVVAAALIGLPDPGLGERPLLYLIIRENANAADSELIAFAAQHVGRDLRMVSVRRVASLPLTPTGKISKAELKDQALCERR